MGKYKIVSGACFSDRDVSFSFQEITELHPAYVFPI